MYFSKKSLSNQITGTTISQITSLFFSWIVAHPKLKYKNYRPLSLIIIASFSFNRASVDIVEMAESIIGKVDICTELLVWRQCGSGARISVLLPALRSLVHSAWANSTPYCNLFTGELAGRMSSTWPWSRALPSLYLCSPTSKSYSRWVFLHTATCTKLVGDSF